MATEYGKKTTDTSHSTQGASASKSGGENSGVTGSSRHYPKGKGSTTNTNWNPMKMKASTYGICGVD